jgi:high-affinity nickel permease
LSAKLLPTFADRGCRVVSATDPHSRILGFLDRITFPFSHYYYNIVIVIITFKGSFVIALVDLFTILESELFLRKTFRLER